MKLRALDRARRRHLAAGLWHLARARALHALWPAPRIMARLRAPMLPGRAQPPDPALMGWALAALGRRVPWRADCLVQALAARLWAERSGTAAALRLGAHRGASGLVAHAWLEVGGMPVSGGAPSASLRMFDAAEGPQDAEMH
jgi:hypothetical protein